MKALHSDSFESLVLHFAGFGLLTVVNNLWTWVAAGAAAGISLWRVRASATPATISHRVSDEPRITNHDSSSSGGSKSTEEPPVCYVSRCTIECNGAPAVTRVRSGLASAFDSGASAVTKGKFIVYYEDDCLVAEDDDRAAMTECLGCSSGCDGGCRGRELWWAKWEKMVRTRSGEAEWYGYQDLRAIDGSVVRLWDGGRPIGGGRCVRAQGVGFAG
ncbi:uncharacterized protein LOC116193725 [Punica granatum]|uniref:Uncharacterized protein n=2 Tax=Punica granatum TaxID=22663 RepID=A0A218WQV7_PUNGR|nr:uncharacterized protein LOC116193725 [Punica granatum]OWM74362.1 hypothetical protein CDL15_Pgr013266 [Punica granatum]PKI75360.1 hypothetical protein CRG98_004244 [Punica granatum]